MQDSLLAALNALATSEVKITGIGTPEAAKEILPKAKWRFYASVNVGRIIHPSGQVISADNGVFYTNSQEMASYIRAMGLEEL